MKRRDIKAIVVIAASLLAVLSVTIAAQDRYTLKALNGVAFSEFRGYEAWQSVAPSQTDDGIKVISGNTVLINAYNSGIPANGKAVPDGARFAKIEWSKRKNVLSPYTVNVPDTLKSVAFMVKDSKRFADTGGWGFAQFLYDAPSNSFKPFGADSSFGKTCFQCHTRAKATDFVFTSYARR